MAKSFVSTGCFPCSDNTFEQFCKRIHGTRGTISIKPTGTVEEFYVDLHKLSLAECIAISEELENNRIVEEERTVLVGNSEDDDSSDDDDSDDENINMN